MKICPESAGLTALREGWLEADEAIELREHVEKCRTCSRVLAGLDEIVELLSKYSGPIEPPPGDYEGLLRAAMLMRDRITQLPVAGKPRWVWRTVAAAGMIMIVLAAYSIIDTGSPPPPATIEISEEDDIPDFFIEEHVLATEILPFSDGVSAISLVPRERR